MNRALGPGWLVLGDSGEPHQLAIDTSLASTTIIGVIGLYCCLDVSLEGFIASILFGSFGLGLALVVLGVPVVGTFGPIVVVSRNTARVGFLLVRGIVALVVVVISLAIRRI